MFVLRSPAALGLYWLIGNTYSTIQAIINEKFSGRRLMQLKENIDYKKEWFRVKERVYEVKDLEEAKKLAINDFGLPLEDLSFDVVEERKGF